MAAGSSSFYERVLVPATGKSSLAWPAVGLTALFSVLVHLFGSLDLDYVNIAPRAVIAAVSVLPTFALVSLAFSLPIKKLQVRVIVVLVSYVLGGVARGLLLSLLLEVFDFTEGFIWQGRVAFSIAFITVTVSIATYFWTNYTNNVGAVAELREETAQLQSALAQLELEAQAQSVQQVADVSNEIVRELERIELYPAGAQEREIQRVINERVRPLSHQFAQEVRSWQPVVVLPPEARQKTIWRELDLTAKLPSMWLAFGYSLTTFPGALETLGFQTALLVSLASVATLVPAVFIAFWVARKVVPRLVPPWRELVFTLIVLAAAILGVTGNTIALIGTERPYAYVLAGLTTFPVYTWVLAVAGALWVDVATKEQALTEVSAQLRWAIARINLLAWYNRGIVSRLLHGPIQNSLHATAIRLKNADPEVVVDYVIRDLRQRIAETSPTTLVGKLDDADLNASLAEATRLWRGIAEVKITVSPAALSALELDLPAAEIVLDLCNEACSNAVRHGKAKNVAIEVAVSGSLLELTVFDDGAGAAATTGKGLGTRFLDSCSVSWQISQREGKNLLQVQLPVSSVQVDGRPN
jgi:signal transduction histidine kinase